jgi:phosphohistidine phosphatase SixA
VKLGLLRHGEAGHASRDALRELTPRGWLDARRIGDLIHARQTLPDLVWVSPLLRAQQTAEAVFHACGQPVHLKEQPLLIPEADLSALMQALESVSSDILLVGHNPVLSELLSLLTGQRTPMLGTANLAWLDGDRAAAGCMRLLQIDSAADA